MTTAHITEAQRLDPDALVELFTLDTSTCRLSATPGGHSIGEIYRWCAGAIDQRESGVLAEQAPSQSAVTVAPAPIHDSQSSYVFAVENPATGQWVGPTLVASISGATINLAFPLGFVPPAGAAWNLHARRSVKFAGATYTAMSIEATGFEWSGQGKMPRPKLRVSNIGGFAAGLLIAFGDLLGATITRTRTFARFLDGQPGADPTASYEPEIFRVDRKAAHNRVFVEFELASEIDQLGLRLPRRQMLRNTCGFTYRRRIGGAWVYGTCPYAGAGMFTIANEPTQDPTQDVCDHHMTGCLARFGADADIPIESFPGLALVRV